jgi:hypothetical protein
MATRQQHLSPVMAAALQVAGEHGGTLVRRPGEFWTWPGCPEEEHNPDFQPYSAPTWWVGTRTVDALIDRGLVRITGEQVSRGNLHRFAVEVTVVEDQGS